MLNRSDRPLISQIGDFSDCVVFRNEEITPQNMTNLIKAERTFLEGKPSKPADQNNTILVILNGPANYYSLSILPRLIHVVIVNHLILPFLKTIALRHQAAGCNVEAYWPLLMTKMISNDTGLQVFFDEVCFEAHFCCLTMDCPWNARTVFFCCFFGEICEMSRADQVGMETLIKLGSGAGGGSGGGGGGGGGAAAGGDGGGAAGATEEKKVGDMVDRRRLTQPAKNSTIPCFFIQI